MMMMVMMIMMMMVVVVIHRYGRDWEEEKSLLHLLELGFYLITTHLKPLSCCNNRDYIFRIFCLTH